MSVALRKEEVKYFLDINRQNSTTILKAYFEQWVNNLGWCQGSAFGAQLMAESVSGEEVFKLEIGLISLLPIYQRGI